MADGICCSRLGFVEVRAALAAARRGSRISSEDYHGAISTFSSDWRRVAKVAATDGVIRHAADLSERYSLRGYDAVHLSSAIYFRDLSPVEVGFSARDDDIRGAAVREGFVVS